MNQLHIKTHTQSLSLSLLCPPRPWNEAKKIQEKCKDGRKRKINRAQRIKDAPGQEEEVDGLGVRGRRGRGGRGEGGGLGGLGGGGKSKENGVKMMRVQKFEISRPENNRPSQFPGFRTGREKFVEKRFLKIPIIIPLVTGLKIIITVVSLSLSIAAVDAFVVTLLRVVMYSLLQSLI